MSDRKNKLLAILKRFPGTDSHSQRTRILTAIHELGSVTTYEANRVLDCYDPRARKSELKNDLHYPIKTFFRRVTTESGESHRIGVYFIESQGGESC